jgi:hypothetical protein
MTSGRLALPQTLSAVALDTNSGPHGFFDIRRIEELVQTIEAQELDIEIWVPEPVIWEWAEHAYGLATRTSATIRSAARDLDRGGLEVPELFDADSTVDDFVERIEEQLAELYLDHSGVDAVRILRLSAHPESAILGIKDQVLRRGAGVRAKKDNSGNSAKSGAADSAAWRLVAAEATDLTKIVLVTQDTDAQRHFADAEAPHIRSSIWSVRNELLQLIPGSDYALGLVSDSIYRGLLSLSEDALSRANVYGDASIAIPGRDTNYAAEFRVTHVSQVDDVTDIEVSRHDERATASASVTVDLVIDYIRVDPDSLQVEADTTEELGLPATATVGAEAVGDSWSAWVEDFELS